MPTTPDAIAAALAAHRTWKTRLAMAIVQGQSLYDVATVEREDLCPFGKWLLGDPALRQARQFAGVRALHATFHLEAARVLKLALEGRKDQARAALDAGGPFDAVSASLARALLDWRQAS